MRDFFIALLIGSMMAGPMQSCEGNPPPKEVCDACKVCEANPTMEGCPLLIASGVCARCGSIPPPSTSTTTTTTTTFNPQPTPTPTPIPTPTPNPNNCTRQVQPATCSTPMPGEWKGDVNAALHSASGCPINQVCRVLNWRQTIVRTMELLEANGYCVSFDIDSGNCWFFAPNGECLRRGLGSEMGVRKGLSKTEFYQPITATENTRWADPRSICRPAFDEETLEQTRAHLNVGPEPVPTPTPGPTPIPPPSGGLCTNPTPGPLAKWEVKVHVRGPNWTTLDSTALVGPDAMYCSQIGYTDGRRFCPPRTEGTAEAIIRQCLLDVVGQPPFPVWKWNGSTTLPEGIQHDDNPYHLLVRPWLHGTAEVCGSNGVCGELVL